MIEFSMTKLAVAVGGLALTVAGGAGIASASPDLGAIVNTTCNYDQVMSALNAQDSATAQQFGASPMTQSGLRQFLDAPRDERQKMAEAIARFPANQPYIGLIQQVFNTCSSF